MAMTLDDDQWIDEFFMCENQSSDPFNSDKSDENKAPLYIESMSQILEKEEETLVDKSDENKEPLDIESMSQIVEKEEETLVNKNQCQGGVESKSGNSNVNNDKGKDKNCRISSHEKHARAERERRKKMRSMLDSLQGLIPHLTYKVDSVTIVEETVKYIKHLEQTLVKLEKQKKEKLKSFGEAFTADQRSFSLNSQMVTSNALAFQQMWFSQNVTFNICGDEAQFCIYSTKKPSLLTTIFCVMEKHKIDVIHANILSNNNGNSYMIQAHVKRATHQNQNAISLEESYKLAAGEIVDLLKF